MQTGKGPHFSSHAGQSPGASASPDPARPPAKAENHPTLTKRLAMLEREQCLPGRIRNVPTRFFHRESAGFSRTTTHCLIDPFKLLLPDIPVSDIVHGAPASVADSPAIAKNICRCDRGANAVCGLYRRAARKRDNECLCEAARSPVILRRAQDDTGVTRAVIANEKRS
jgi:hypothetical protein